MSEVRSTLAYSAKLSQLDWRISRQLPKPTSLIHSMPWVVFPCRELSLAVPPWTSGTRLARDIWQITGTLLISPSNALLLTLAY